MQIIMSTLLLNVWWPKIQTSQGLSGFSYRKQCKTMVQKLPMENAEFFGPTQWHLPSTFESITIALNSYGLFFTFAWVKLTNQCNHSSIIMNRSQWASHNISTVTIILKKVQLHKSYSQKLRFTGLYEFISIK